MTPGAVMIHDDFVFHDGHRAKKLFVIIGLDNGIFLLVKTTSQQNWKPNSSGCNPDPRFHNYFIPAGPYFHKDTWVCLHEFYEYDFDELTDLWTARTVRNICRLPPSIIADLQNCARSSNDISDDQIDLMN